MINIISVLSFKLNKNNSNIIAKNNIAYSKIFDKILFEIDEFKYYLLINKQYIEFHRENNDYYFNLKIGKANTCELYLKKEKLSLPIDIEYISNERIKDGIIIKYRLATEDDINEVVIEGIK